MTSAAGRHVAPIKPLVELREGALQALNFHPGQMRAWESKKRIIAILAGTQSGKTGFGPWWLAREVVEHEGGDHLAVTANFPLFKLKMLPELKRCFVDILKIGKYWAGPKIIEIRDPDNGKFWAKESSDDEMYGRIILRSAKAGKTKDGVGVGGLESATAQSAWLDEAGLDDFSIATWDAINARLSLSMGRVLITTTLYNWGWLRSQVYVPWTQGDPDIECVQFDSIMNPMFPMAEYRQRRAKMPRWKFNMRYRGVYERPAGAVYECFNEERHVIKAYPLEAKYPVYVGVDPSGGHVCTVWLAWDSKRSKYVAFRETFETGLSTAGHTAHFKKAASGLNVQVVRGGAPSEDQQRLDWQANGVPMMLPNVTDVEGGISRVTELLMLDRLEIMDCCPMLIGQLAEYSRKLDADQQPMEAIKDKEKYHYADALRYVCSGPMAAQQGGYYFTAVKGR
jgi:hypothetical protein